MKSFGRALRNAVGVVSILASPAFSAIVEVVNVDLISDFHVKNTPTADSGQVGPVLDAGTRWNTIRRSALDGSGESVALVNSFNSVSSYQVFFGAEAQTWAESDLYASYGPFVMLDGWNNVGWDASSTFGFKNLDPTLAYDVYLVGSGGGQLPVIKTSWYRVDADNNPLGGTQLTEGTPDATTPVTHSSYVLGIHYVKFAGITGVSEVRFRCIGATESDGYPVLTGMQLVARTSYPDKVINVDLISDFHGKITPTVDSGQVGPALDAGTRWNTIHRSALDGAGESVALVDSTNSVGSYQVFFGSEAQPWAKSDMYASYGAFLMLDGWDNGGWDTSSTFGFKNLDPTLVYNVYLVSSGGGQNPGVRTSWYRVDADNNPVGVTQLTEGTPDTATPITHDSYILGIHYAKFTGITGVSEVRFRCIGAAGSLGYPVLTGMQLVMPDIPPPVGTTILIR